MARYRQFLIVVTLICGLAGCGEEPTKGPAEKGTPTVSGTDVNYFSNARLIPGDGSPVMDDVVFVVLDSDHSRDHVLGELRA